MYQCALSVILQHSTAENSAMKEVVSTFTMACLPHAYACVRSDVFDIKHRSVHVVCSTFCINLARVISALIKLQIQTQSLDSVSSQNVPHLVIWHKNSDIEQRLALDFSDREVGEVFQLRSRKTTGAKRDGHAEGK